MMMKDIYSKGGIKNLYNGNAGTLMRKFPYAGLEWGIYDYLMLNSDTANYSKIAKCVHELCVGAFSGLVAQTVTHPIDTIRTRVAANT